MKIYFSLAILCATSAGAFVPHDRAPFSVATKQQQSLLMAYGKDGSIAEVEDAYMATSKPMTYKDTGSISSSLPMDRLEARLEQRRNRIPESSAPVPVVNNERNPRNPGSSSSAYLLSRKPLNTIQDFNEMKEKFTSSSTVTRGGSTNLSEKARMMDVAAQIKIQGNSLKTWAFQTPMIDRVQVIMKTEGRPLNANVDLWQGPDNIPQRIKVYIEDGAERPFNAILQTPGGQNSVAIRNTNTMEFPLEACIEAEVDGKVNIGLQDDVNSLKENAVGRTIQGGAVFTKPFPADVQSVQVLLTCDGRPLNARLELLQGPNNIKQVVDVYCEDGRVRPFYMIIETPDPGCVIRIVNTATLEFPLAAYVEPYIIDDSPPEGITSFFIVD